MKAFYILRDNFKKILIKSAVILFWITAWFALFKIVNSDFVLCSPVKVLQNIFEMAVTKEFWIITAVSILRISAGYLSGIIFGIIIAVFTTQSNILNELFKPLLTVIKTTPVASFILLVLVWLKKDYVPTFISFLIVLPIVWSNISTGILNVDRKMIEVGKIYNFSILKKFRHIYIPFVKPYFFSACTTALGLSWKAGIAAGVLCQPDNSIGAMLYSSKIYLETDKLFAWTVVVIIISVIFEKIVKSLIDKVRG